MKEVWKPGNMLYPLPAVLVTSRNKAGQDNVCTVAWTGTVCSDPVMLSISLRKSRLSYANIMETGVFAVNLSTRELAFATDFCGVRSGRDIDKFAAVHLTKEDAEGIDCCVIGESPVNLCCRVCETRDLGSHTMIIAEVTAVMADKKYMDEHGKFDLRKADPIVYNHGVYYTLGHKIGTFGYSVKQKGRK